MFVCWMFLQGLLGHAPAGLLPGHAPAGFAYIIVPITIVPIIIIIIVTIIIISSVCMCVLGIPAGLAGACPGRSSAGACPGRFCLHVYHLRHAGACLGTCVFMCSFMCADAYVRDGDGDGEHHDAYVKFPRGPSFTDELCLFF